jgi:D-lactate dehydrogenase
MRVTVFSTQPYDQRFLAAANPGGRHELVFLESRLEATTAAASAGGQAVCAFVNDRLDAACLGALHDNGVRLVALRCAGFNNVDLAAAAERGLAVCRVPEYSPYAVAEHTAALVMALNRKLHRAHARVREGNFSLEGLMGIDLHGRTVGVVGTGKIGECFLRIMRGFGCRLLAHDPQPSPDCIALGMSYVPLADLLAASDIVSLHCPLTPQTHHLIGEAALGAMKPGAMLVNTSRGAVVDTPAVIRALKRGRLGGHRRVRGGGGPLLSGSFGRGDPGRRVRAAAHFSQRARHSASGVLHGGCAGRDRRYHHGQPRRVRGSRRAGARGRDRAAGLMRA